jgi:phasin family protein
MSQKPRGGAQVRPAVTKVAAAAMPKPEMETMVESSKPEPAVTTEAVPDIVPEPMQIAAPAPDAPPEPVAALEPVVEVPVEVPVSPPVEDVMVAASDVAATVIAPVEDIATAPVETIAAATAESVEQTAAITPTSPTLTQGLTKMMKSTEELVAFSQANMEAFVKSGQIWSAGMQELTKQIASSAKASFDESVSTFKAMSTAKSVKEAMELQSTFAKSALEKAMAESNKLTDASIKLTEETLAPITARVTVAVESFKTH